MPVVRRRNQVKNYPKFTFLAIDEKTRIGLCDSINILVVLSFGMFRLAVRSWHFDVKACAEAQLTFDI